jgi:uncharacterized Ntn-hydrolase superfamily protein
MTFSILGRDPDTGDLGIAIATYSLAVGATCPKILPGIGVVTSQASTNPAIAEEIMELIEDGLEPIESFMQALANDEHPEFRQVALLLPLGDALVHSGENIKPSSGNVNGENCTAVGNFLDNDNVLSQMVSEFESPAHAGVAELSLASRLLAALHAGKEAGGQSGSDGNLLPERSACMMIGTPGESFPIDIRVDASENAIADLRRAYEQYLPMHEFYLKRAEDPTDLPSQDNWLNRDR